MGRASEEEEETFLRKVHTLRDVAIDLTDVLKAQNKQLKNIEPLFAGTYSRLRSNIMRLGSMDAKKFRGWLFYFLTSLFFLLLLFVFYFVF